MPSLPVIENFQLLLLPSDEATSVFCPILGISGDGPTPQLALEDWKRKASAFEALHFYDFNFLVPEELVFSRKIWIGQQSDHQPMFLIDYPMADQGVVFFPGTAKTEFFRWSEMGNCLRESSGLFDERISCSRLYSLAPTPSAVWHERSLTPHHL
jgi:hypothetical protein